VLKVPMVFYSPSIIKPKIYDKRVRTVDLLPTLNDLIFKEDARFDGSSLKEIIYENKVEDDRDAFSAVWVNEAHIVLNKIKRILKGGAITTNHSQAVKYSFCYYNSDFKYLKQYKKFINRSERLIEYDKDSLFRIIGDTLVPEKNDGMAEIMEGKGRKLNDIKVQRENILVTNRLKKYFNLQGYNV
jgi:arylsulfatase A-like enzyme